MAHTPTPWRLSETCDHRPSIMDANGHNIASWDPATIELFGDPRPWIITACNAHDELVAVAKELIEYMSNSLVIDADADACKLYDHANQALAKAKKG